MAVAARLRGGVLLQRGKKFRGPGALGADHTSQYRRHEIQLRSAYVACRCHDNSSTAWHGFIASHFLSPVPGAKLQWIAELCLRARRMWYALRQHDKPAFTTRTRPLQRKPLAHSLGGVVANSVQQCPVVCCMSKAGKVPELACGLRLPF